MNWILQSFVILQNGIKNLSIAWLLKDKWGGEFKYNMQMHGKY